MPFRTRRFHSFVSPALNSGGPIILSSFWQFPFFLFLLGLIFPKEAFLCFHATFLQFAQCIRLTTLNAVVSGLTSLRSFPSTSPQLLLSSAVEPVSLAFEALAETFFSASFLYPCFLFVRLFYLSFLWTSLPFRFSFPKMMLCTIHTWPLWTIPHMHGTLFRTRFFSVQLFFFLEFSSPVFFFDKRDARTYICSSDLP